MKQYSLIKGAGVKFNNRFTVVPYPHMVSDGSGIRMESPAIRTCLDVATAASGTSG